MQLTARQTYLVEKYLEVKNFNYLDIRSEILDHIISDIEEKIENKNIDFSVAFCQVKKLWNHQLDESSSLYFGLHFSAPRIIINKAKKIYKKYFFTLLFSYFFPLITLSSFNYSVKSTIEFFPVVVFKAVIISALFTFFYLFFTKTNTHKTTFSFVLKTQSLNVFLGLLVAMVFLSNPKEINAIHISMFSAYLFSVCNYYIFYKKHQRVIRNYKLLGKCN
ncbi:hypothetical protein [Polaribacter tangerinus]|uniref:hypothetical protein n=1 Tax=Polaribacter tangerinus TaxID=1920034 RepID=UPI000B4B105E|nr:hypothetical protein [Polaribacter tangerinus]